MFNSHTQHMLARIMYPSLCCRILLLHQVSTAQVYGSRFYHSNFCSVYTLIWFLDIFYYNLNMILHLYVSLFLAGHAVVYIIRYRYRWPQSSEYRCPFLGRYNEFNFCSHIIVKTLPCFERFAFEFITSHFLLHFFIGNACMTCFKNNVHIIKFISQFNIYNYNVNKVHKLAKYYNYVISEA